MELKSWLERCPLVAILRGVRPDEVEGICSALQKAGICVVEVPLNSPEPMKSISILAKNFGQHMLVGAGTLTNSSQVAEVAGAGGKLIVTPHADTNIVRAAKTAGLVAVPGFFNPTEAFALLDAGADALKLFPAGVLGPPMLRALRSVLPAKTIVIPVGGVEAEDVPLWMSAGAGGLGAGTSLYRPGDDPETVEKKAKALVTALDAFRSGVGVEGKFEAINERAL